MDAYLPQISSEVDTLFKDSGIKDLLHFVSVDKDNLFYQLSQNCQVSITPYIFSSQKSLVNKKNLFILNEASLICDKWNYYATRLGQHLSKQADFQEMNYSDQKQYYSRAYTLNIMIPEYILREYFTLFAVSSLHSLSVMFDVTIADIQERLWLFERTNIYAISLN